ncbi:hypothetical protein J7J23_01750 [bacterium]|nr:hypothetical protein [bacterium]
MPKFYEFFFNPKLDKNIIFDTFCFTPETNQEKRLGWLYMAGQLKNALLQGKNLLQNIAEVAQQEYYNCKNENSEECFKLSLQKVNKFLAEEIADGNTSWLGNLSFSIINILPDFSTRISKTDGLILLVLKDKEIFSINDNLKYNQPTKAFSNIISGKLEKNNKIIISNPEIIELFQERQILKEILYDEKAKKIKKIFRSEKNFLKEAFGFCLLVVLRNKKFSLKKTELKRRKPIIRWLIPSFVDPFAKPTNPTAAKLKRIAVILIILAILLLFGHFIFAK